MYPYSLYLQQLQQNVKPTQVNAQTPSSNTSQPLNYGMQEMRFPVFPNLQNSSFPIYNPFLGVNPVYYGANLPMMFGSEQVYKNWLSQMNVGNIQNSRGPFNNFQMKSKIKLGNENRQQSNFQKSQEQKKHSIYQGQSPGFKVAFHKDFRESEQSQYIQQLDFDFNKKATKFRTDPSDQLIQLSKEDELQPTNIQIDSAKNVVQSFFSIGYGKGNYQDYLKQRYPSITPKDLDIARKRYFSKITRLLIKIPVQLVDFLNLKFDMNEPYFDQVQVKCLMKVLRYYKLHFNEDHQRSIEQIARYLMKSQKISINKEKMNSLYQKCRQILKQAKPNYRIKPISRQKRINAFILTKQAQIKERVMQKGNKQSQDKQRDRFKQQIINCFLQTEKKNEWVKFYKCINPLSQKNLNELEVIQLFKEIFLEAYYKLEISIPSSKVPHVRLYLEHIKSSVLFQRILVPTYRQLAMILLKVYAEKEEIPEQKADMYMQRMKAYLKSSNVNNSLQPNERYEYDRNEISYDLDVSSKSRDEDWE